MAVTAVLAKFQEGVFFQPVLKSTTHKKVTSFSMLNSTIHKKVTSFNMSNQC